MRAFFLYLFSVVALGYIFTANAATSTIGFSSVAEALKTVEKQTGARVITTEPDKWTIVNIDARDGGMEQWSFTPEGHYAHPAVAKRTIKVGADGQIYLESAYLCEAQKEPCDRLVKEFETLNEQIRNNIQRRLSGTRK